jgi:hypothetical protein
MAHHQARPLPHGLPAARWDAPPDELGEFATRLDDWTVLAQDPFSPADSRPYIAVHMLRSYLTDEQLRKLLRWVTRPLSQLGVIRDNYLIVFAILLSIDKGTYIGHFVLYDQFVDSRLPFDDCEWPPGCEPARREFVDAQWRFCAKSFERGRLNDTMIPPQMVLPFDIKAILKEDSDLRVCVIEIPAHYNLLNQVSALAPAYWRDHVTNSPLSG